MNPRALRAAGAASLIAALCVVTSGCGSDSASGGADRPAHRPVSVVYVTGDERGPWGARTQGLADGVKMAIAERDGLIGERAVSIAVVPTEQRDGDTISAAIGAGRILRDSRTLAVLGTYSAPQLGLSAPQLNGGEISLLQFGSGMRGLTAQELPGEPGRYEPSGARYAVRGVASDDAVADAFAERSELRGADVIAVTDVYEAGLKAAARERASRAQKLRDKAIENGDDDAPSTSPALTDPSPEQADAVRLAGRIAAATDGRVAESGAPGRGGTGSTPRIVVVDPTEPDPSAAIREALRGAGGPVAVIDAADRTIQPSAVRSSGGSPVFTVRRRLADAASERGREIRARERELFGRDRGDAVVAGYLAARRILELAASQPEKTIDRVAYAEALSGPAEDDPDFPVDADGDSLLASATLLERSGNSWRPAR